MRIFSSVYHQTSVRPPGHHLSARYIITAILLNYAPARNRTLVRNVEEYQSSTRQLVRWYTVSVIIKYIINTVYYLNPLTFLYKCKCVPTPEL